MNSLLYIIALLSSAVLCFGGRCLMVNGSVGETTYKPIDVYRPLKDSFTGQPCVLFLIVDVEYPGLSHWI